MNKYIQYRFLLLNFMVIFTFQPLFPQKANPEKAVRDKLKTWVNPLTGWRTIGSPKIDSVIVTHKPNVITLFFSSDLSYYPFRENSYTQLIQSFSKPLGRKFRKYKIEVITNNYSPDKLIPNYYRKDLPLDSSRIPTSKKDRKVLVTRENTYKPLKGLFGNSIALWASHGYYYEMTLDRWEWQRARLFGTVEDISVIGYVVPYLTRMLENAGANVYLPRERDVQTNEVIIDNDRSSGNSEFTITGEKRAIEKQKGFLIIDTLFTGVNPFTRGTSLRLICDSVTYLPDIPLKGDYSVYVSYPQSSKNSSNAIYTVYHTGGSTEFVIDQQMGGGTWIYLGNFKFDKGKDLTKGSVTLKSGSQNEVIAADAIKIGGGMGNVARRPSEDALKNQKSIDENISEKRGEEASNPAGFSWKISGVPRYLEGSRYWLQYAGMPDSSVYSPTNNKNDYNDDYQSRGLWVNYLKKDPVSSSGSQTQGLGLPIDLSFAFHTDAGITRGDSVIGTLAICYTSADNGKFSNGTSRLASRDLSDIIQTQVVEDIRSKYKSDWTRRGLWDKPYSEARRPDVPSVLLELLSHQNLEDMRFNLDPRFRFDVCRSVYKGILKYLTYVENREYVVQPLPVTKFAVSHLKDRYVRLSWDPVTDPGEPSSEPEKYRIYTRLGDNGFDNGILTENTYMELELPTYDSIYSFKVTALNEGGESFDSEVLSAGIRSVSMGNVLVVNVFDRICGPSWFKADTLAGISWWNDRGIAYKTDLITVGDQYDYNVENPWMDDDSPGWGASYNDLSGKIIPGNSFDFPYVHGRSIMAAGYSFFSVSGDYFNKAEIDITSFEILDLILGEEKSTTFFNNPSRTDFSIYKPEFMQKLEVITRAGKPVFMSGSYIGTDLFNKSDSTAIRFAEQTLHFIHRTGHAARTGRVYVTDYAKPAFSGTYEFNCGDVLSIYAAESPDAIEPAGKGAVTTLRYYENNASAGVAFKGNCNTFIMGFPFETIRSDFEKDLLMKQIINFLIK